MRRFWLLLLSCCTISLWAQPKPGDVFREYTWVPDRVSESGKFLRVGGRLDYQINPKHLPADQHDNGHIFVPQAFDMTGAIRAELVMELVQSHEDTKGLRVQINNQAWLPVPALQKVPQPQSAYMLHAYPIVPIPLDYLKAGSGNTFKLEVDTAQVWNWPQHIFYGFTFRIYYESAKATLKAKMQGVSKGEVISDTIRNLSIAFKQSANIKKVDYIGYYDDLNWEGDGVYRQWHYHFHRGLIKNHIGSATAAPFNVKWDMAWLPDQSKPMKIAARVTDNTGLTYFTMPVTDLQLSRNYSIELCKPYDQPENWATREEEFSEKLAIRGDLSAATAYQLIWKSWSPCYANGIFVNKEKVLQEEGPCYDYYEHRLNFSDTSPLQSGENTVTTGKTPLYDGKMVHGMEVQYPGIMMKIRYRKKQLKQVQISSCTYEDRPHFLITTPSAIYYFDKAGGGLSRLIDTEGNDWIAFKMKPWGEYPAAAASAFRGIPNFVHGSEDAGAGHPGHDQCTSEQVDDRTIHTTSKSGKWQWTWQFFEHYARLNMEKVDPDHAYWLLYEGTPGGKFEPIKQYFGTDKGGPRFDQSDFYKGNKIFDQWKWAYFGHKDADRVFYLAQQEADQLNDTFSYLGNSEAGIKSEDGMIVFGFGRADGAKPLMKTNNTFIMGFYDQKIETTKAHRKLGKIIKKRFKR